MSNILTGISGLLRATWNFLMHTFIPGTGIAFGVLFVALCVIDLGFKFLSIATGYSLGDLSASRFTIRPKVKSGRSEDVR